MHYTRQTNSNNRYKIIYSDGCEMASEKEDKTIDKIFIFTNISEMAKMKQKELYLAYIDLTCPFRAFQSYMSYVSRHVL